MKNKSIDTEAQATKRADNIAAALHRLAHYDICTDENKALIVQYPDYAIDTAAIIWYLHQADPTFINNAK